MTAVSEIKVRPVFFIPRRSWIAHSKAIVCQCSVTQFGDIRRPGGEALLCLISEWQTGAQRSLMGKLMVFTLFHSLRERQQAALMADEPRVCAGDYFS